MITVLVADGVPAHQLTTPGLVFGSASHVLGHTAYDVRICSATRTVTTGEPPLSLATPWGLEALDDADTVLVTGHRAFRDPPPPEAADALRACADRDRTIAAVGTGTFTLAATGLLDGRRATTSWPHTGELAGRHPRVEVVPVGAPWVEDGPYLTSHGVFGGIDLCLSMVERDHGEPTAAAVARRIIMPLYDEAVADTGERVREIAGRTDIGPTRQWVEANLHRPLTLADMAGHARVSVSSLHRRFRAQTGLPPLQYLLRARLHRAQQLLESGDTPVEQIAARSGFGSPANLRHHFHRLTGTTPRAYRAALRGFTAAMGPYVPASDAPGAPGGTGTGPGTANSGDGDGDGEPIPEPSRTSATAMSSGSASSSPP
ncbi:helix-turn-helix domain-containing protein [Streptomyces katsurahamanus]|uniref:Helix-turn-helix domain-containing protein n=1 Tax=Streptomyces katsurahamanus TaxID=2577098 RepID=A0ABW9P2L2_9ACTN|nr:helix-turn-helix domain-containing protein [Streptomyces katsurahamanus]